MVSLNQLDRSNLITPESVSASNSHCSLCIIDKEEKALLAGRSIIFLDMDGVLFPTDIDHVRREKIHQTGRELFGQTYTARDPYQWREACSHHMLTHAVTNHPQSCQSVVHDLFTKKAPSIFLVKFLLLYKSYNKERFDALDSKAIFKGFRASFRFFFEENSNAETPFQDTPFSLECFNSYLIDHDMHSESMFIIADEDTEANGPFHRAALFWILNAYDPFKCHMRRPCRFIYSDNREIARAAVARLIAICESLTNKTDPKQVNNVINDLLAIEPTEYFTAEIKQKMIAAAKKAMGNSFVSE